MFTLLLKILACLFLGTAVLTILFHLSVKLRLALPFLYFCFLSLSTIFSDFAYTPKALYIMIALLSLSAFSWLISLVRFIRRRREEKFWEEDIIWQIRTAREQGISLDLVSFDADHNLLDPNTGKPLTWC